ncbi:MAG: MscL family protein [Candidatus Paceibacterota bacterium]|jgi:large conductance mechanosensitive channel
MFIDQTKNNAVTKTLSNSLQGFLEFVRTQGVIGLAIAVVLGTAVTKLVGSLVKDIINPVVGIFLGRLGDLNAIVIPVYGTNANIAIGSFISALIDFAIIAGVVYFVVKGLKLDKLDKSKS